MEGEDSDQGDSRDGWPKGQGAASKASCPGRSPPSILQRLGGWGTSRVYLLRRDGMLVPMGEVRGAMRGRKGDGRNEWETRRGNERLMVSGSE